MGLQATIMGRVGRVVTQEVPGVGPVRFKRLSWVEARALPDMEPETVVAATVLAEEGEGLFFSDAATVKAGDWAIVAALANASYQVNGLGIDLKAAEKK